MLLTRLSKGVRVARVRIVQQCTDSNHMHGVLDGCNVTISRPHTAGAAVGDERV